MHNETRRAYANANALVRPRTGSASSHTTRAPPGAGVTPSDSISNSSPTMPPAIAERITVSTLATGEFITASTTPQAAVAGGGGGGNTGMLTPVASSAARDSSAASRPLARRCAAHSNMHMAAFVNAYRQRRTCAAGAPLAMTFTSARCAIRICISRIGPRISLPLACDAHSGMHMPTRRAYGNPYDHSRSHLQPWRARRARVVRRP